MPTPITSLDQLDPNGSYSYADYSGWEFEEIVELFHGRITRRAGSPTDRHQAVLGELNCLLYDEVRRQKGQLRLGPYDVRLPKPGPIPCRTLPGLNLDWADIFADNPGQSAVA